MSNTDDRKWPFSIGWIQSVIFISILLFLLAAGQASTEKKILLAVRPGEDPEFFITKEVTVMIDLLSKAGYAVEIASPSGEDLEYKSGRLKVDSKLSDIQIGNYAALLVPCMGASAYKVPEDLASLVNDADSRGMLIAAQHSLEVTLAAGLYIRKVATGPGIEIDGNLITSYNCPMTARENSQPIDTEELINRLVNELKKQ